MAQASPRELPSYAWYVWSEKHCIQNPRYSVCLLSANAAAVLGLF